MRYHISWVLFGYISNLEIVVPYDGDDVATCFRRTRVGVITNFSTRGGMTLVRMFALSSAHGNPGIPLFVRLLVHYLVTPSSLAFYRSMQSTPQPSDI